MKKTNNKATAIIMMLVGIVFCALNAIPNIKALTNNSVNIYDLIEEEGEVPVGTYVEIPVDAVIGNYAETEHTTNGIPTGTDQHYMIWLDTEEFISLTVKNKDIISQLDSICDDTWDFIDGFNRDLPKPTSYYGVVVRLDSELQGYFKQWTYQLGISDSDCYFVSVDLSKNQKSVMMLSLVGFLIFAGGLAWFIAENKKGADTFGASSYNANGAANYQPDTTMQGYNFEVTDNTTGETEAGNTADSYNNNNNNNF